jgi:hypothetical protein
MFRAARVLCRPAASARLSAAASARRSSLTSAPVALIDHGRIADRLRAIMLQSPDTPVNLSADVHRVLELVLLAIVHCGSQYLALHRALPTAATAGDLRQAQTQAQVPDTQLRMLLDKEHEWHHRLQVLTLLLRRLCRLQQPMPPRTFTSGRVPAMTSPVLSPRAQHFVWRVRRQSKARLKAAGRRRMLGMLHSGTFAFSNIQHAPCPLSFFQCDLILPHHCSAVPQLWLPFNNQLYTHWLPFGHCSVDLRPCQPPLTPSVL